MNFFDKHPVCHPWPDLLRQSWSLTYKPREVWWKKRLEKFGFGKGDRVLEVGCGEGILLDQLTTKYQVRGVGIDASSEAVKRAKQKSNNDYYLGDATKLPFDNNSFDVVISFDTMEHVLNKERMVSEMSRVLKPKGKIVIFTINRRQRFTWNWLLSKVGIDVYKNVDHDPNLFVDFDDLKVNLNEKQISGLKVDYFNSFFSLLIDEGIMVFLSLWQHLFGWEKTSGYGRIILRIFTFVSTILMPVCYFLEYPWRKLGHSNGLLVIGYKK